MVTASTKENGKQNSPANFTQWELFWKTILTPRVSLLGLASWVLPFVLSFLFFDQTGELTVPRPLFKSLIVIAGGGIGLALLVIVFRQIKATFRSGVTIGFYWLILNLVLDLLILVPMSGMSVSEYFYDIGLRYFLLPMMAVAMGLVAQRSS